MYGNIPSLAELNDHPLVTGALGLTPPLAPDNPDALTELGSLLDAYAETPPTTQDDVEDLIGAFKRAKDGEDAAADPWRQLQHHARLLLNDCIAMTGITKWETSAGKAQITAPSVRVCYSAKALDALCASDPDLDRKLRPHRTETHVDGGLRIS